MIALQVGTYRTVGGELLHYRVDAMGNVRCDVEHADGSRRPGCAVCDCDVLLSDDPDWPWTDRTDSPSLVVLD